MKKKLSRSGSGWALFMPKTLLELIDVDPEKDMLEVKVDRNYVKNVFSSTLKKYDLKKYVLCSTLR